MDRQLVRHASQVIRYWQDGTEIFGPDPEAPDILATHGTNPHTVDDLGVLVVTDDMDWLISRTVLPQDFEPKRGDQITAEIQGQTFKFEVMSSANEPPYRRSDTFGYRLRIHSKKVGLVDADPA